MSERCKICGKELTDPDSVKAGIGPICAEHLERLEEFEQSSTELAEINQIQRELDTVDNVTDVRRLIAMADAYLSAARTTYKATRDVKEAKEDSERAYNIGVKAAEIRLMAVARLGELIREMQERGELASQNTGNPDLKCNTVVTLEELGLSRMESSRAQKIAENKDLIPKIVKESIIAGDFPTQKALLKKANVHVSNNSGEIEWYTPREYVEAARLTMGSIDVDPASSDMANKIIGAERYFTKENDGLEQTWRGNVWMNPPYSQPLVTEFCNLLVEKYLLGETIQACVLVNNATETNFYQNMLKYCKAVCFIKGRVKFIDKDGNSSGAPLQGQTILYFGDNPKIFEENFSYFGVVLHV